MWSIGDILVEKVGAQLAPADLRPSVVVVLSAHHLIVGLYPFFLPVDFVRNESVVWSRPKCLEDMRVRNTPLGPLFAKGVDLLFLGKLDHSPLLDMQPVSALAVADNDPSHIFSLHTD